MTRLPKNIVASILARLRNVAQDAGLSFNDILQAYVIERFLARLARSPYADTILLKGALMLRVWGVPRARPTMDIDLLRRGIADQAALVRLVEQCAGIDDPSDGVIFELTTISAEPIREATEYVGTRIRLQARLDNVRQTVQYPFGNVANRGVKGADDAVRAQSMQRHCVRAEQAARIIASRLKPHFDRSPSYWRDAVQLGG